MKKNDYFDEENNYLDYSENHNYDDDYDSYDDESYPDDYDKPKYELDSEYSQSDYDDDDDYKSEDDFNYDIDSSLDENAKSEFEKELDELDKSEVVLDEDDFDYDGSVIPSVSKPKRKRRKKGEKAEKLDMSGSAVRDRFYQIMEDYHSGNTRKKEDALERAMKELEGFIHLIIKRSYSTYTKKYFYDLLQEGYLGVAVGMQKYDPSKSMPSTFFYPYIKHEMQGFITRNVDKTTSHYSTNIKKINKVIAEFEERGIVYTNVDIALQTGMTLETVDQSMAIRKYRDEVHIDACPVNIIDNELEENRRKTPEDEIIAEETTKTIYRTIGTLLTDDEISVLQYRFGLYDTDAISEGEIAKKLAMPKDKVKRLLNRAIRKLRSSELSNLYGDNIKKEEPFLEDIEIPLIPREATESDIEFLSMLDDLDD
jgi:RNA polymerase sigma factor (sigma-70 family)